MKRLALTLTAFLFSWASFSQQSAQEQQLSHAEQFGAQEGTLIERQFLDVGTIKGMTVKVLIIKDLLSETTKTALQLEYYYASSYSQHTKVANLDADEIDGLIKSIKKLQTDVFPSNRDTYTEVSFKSRTGFEIGASYNPDKAKWIAFAQLSRSDKDSLVSLHLEDFETLLALVEKADALMH